MKTFRVVAVGAAALTALGAHAGGWALITVEDPPEYLIAGQPLAIEFTIRPHGRTPADNFTWPSQPFVTLEHEGRPSARGPVEAEKVKGARYRAQITADDTGRVVITVDAGPAMISRSGSFDRYAATRLLPLRVVAAGHDPDPLPLFERGQQLFIATGCVTCHVKGDDPVLTGRRVLAIGPDLTNRHFPADWLTAKLTNPASTRPMDVGQYVRSLVDPNTRMPNLGLTQPEVAALVSYLNRK